MDVRDYCDEQKKKLTRLKEKVYDIFEKIDHVSSSSREKLYRLTDQLRTSIKEVDDKIDELERACPADWDIQKIELDNKLFDLEKEVKKAEKRLPPDAFIG